MFQLFPQFGASVTRRRSRVSLGILGSKVDPLENLTLLSASGLVATVPMVASGDSVTPSAKAPGNFEDHYTLNGGLGPGTLDITQVGVNAHIIITLDDHPPVTNIAIDGIVKGNKLKGSFEGNQNGVTSATIKIKLFEPGSISYRFKWKTAI